MADAVAGGKTCIVCGTDVSGKPRVKDAQGRYVCAGECQQKLAAQRGGGGGGAGSSPARASTPPTSRAPSSRGGEPGAGLSMSDLISDSPMLTAKNCPSCNNPMTNGAVICVRCGFNTSTGKSVHTKVSVEHAPKEKRVKVKGGNRYAQGEFGPSFGKVLLCACAGAALIAGLAAIGPEMVVVSMVLLAILGLVAWGWTVVAAFANDQSGWAICGIVGVFIPFVGLPFLVYAIFLNQEKFSRSLYIASILGWLFWVVVIVAAYGGQMPSISGQPLE